MLIAFSAVVTLGAIQAVRLIGHELVRLICAGWADLWRRDHRYLVAIVSNRTLPFVVVSDTVRVTEVSYWAGYAVLVLTLLLFRLVITWSAWGRVSRQCTTVMTDRARPGDRVIFYTVIARLTRSTISIASGTCARVVIALVTADWQWGSSRAVVALRANLAWIFSQGRSKVTEVTG